MLYSEYYQAKAVRKTIWFVHGCMRNEDHWAFDRALDGENDILEFFVPKDHEEKFLDLMNFFQESGYLVSFCKLENRLKNIG